MRKTVVDSFPDAVASVRALVARQAPEQFVDFGCGRGAVLLAVAAAFPDLPCVGIDFDEQALAAAREALDAAGIGGNVRLIRGDVLDHVESARGMAYCYIGGALNQRLGHALLKNSQCSSVVSLRYPIIGAIASDRIGTEPDALYLYDRAELGRHVEWDHGATLIDIPPGSSYLLGRAIRLGGAGRLSATWRAEGQAGARIVDFEFGVESALPGAATISDWLVGCPPDARPGETSIITLELALDGVALDPVHRLIVRASNIACPAERPIDDPATLAALARTLEGAFQ